MRTNLQHLEQENMDLRSKEWYRSRYPEDPIDVAVCKVRPLCKPTVDTTKAGALTICSMVA